MLKNENKLLFTITVSCLLFSCSNDKFKGNEYVKKNFNDYELIYRIINDSADRYSDSLLYGFSKRIGWDFQIDSMVCINSKKDLLFTTINTSYGVGQYAVSDMADELLGKKINNKWYFFRGKGSLIIPRDMYGKDATHPLTFYELSQIARKHTLESSLVRKNGEYVVSDEWIDKRFYLNGYKTKVEYDSIHWMLIMTKWKEKIDTNEYKPLKNNKPAS